MVKIYLYILFAAGVVFFAPLSATADEQFTFTSYKDIDKLFKEKGYTQENWEKGIREVPRLYLTKIPKEWRDSISDKMSIVHKKELFFRLIGPGILRCNELILADRNRLKDISSKHSLKKEDQLWVLQLAAKYKVVDDKAATVNAKQIAELLKRADIIPPSLAMAQGADESGWGTSRFAEAGNSLFGQWTWGGKGIASKGKQSGKGDYKVASFEHPIDSIAAYMLNLNSNNAYSDLRNKRAEIRSHDKEISGLALVDTMTHYSQRGKAYVQDLKNLIKHNHLEPADTAFLSKDPAIQLIPVGGSAKE
jgi:uncharacterized FlgJ-related protein